MFWAHSSQAQDWRITVGIRLQLCSACSGAKNNWPCKLTAVIRRQPCSVAVAPKNNWQCKLTTVIRRQPCSVAVAPKLSHLSHQCKPCSVAMAPASSPNILFCDDHRELISLWVESLHALTTLFKGLVNDPGSRTLTHPAWSPARSPSRWRVVQAVNSSGQDQHFHRCL